MPTVQRFRHHSTIGRLKANQLRWIQTPDSLAGIWIGQAWTISIELLISLEMHQPEMWFLGRAILEAVVLAATMQKYRSRFADFYGSGAPGKNADFRGAVSGNFTGIQMRVDGLTESFQREIEKDRQLQGGPDKVRETLNGSVYNAVESKQRGLIDMIGNLQTSVRRVHALRSQY